MRAPQKVANFSAALRRYSHSGPKTDWAAVVASPPKRCRSDLACLRPITAPARRCLSGMQARSSCPYAQAVPTRDCFSRCDDGRLLVEGAMSMELPALLARQLGATHVISVHLPAQASHLAPANIFQVVNRCFQIMQGRSEQDWRNDSDLVVTPDVRAVDWDGFGCGQELLMAGEEAASAAVPKIQAWLPNRQSVTASGEPIPASIPA